MMRDEIDATYRAVHERGIDQLEPSDLDKMPFTQAFMKVSKFICLRLNNS